MLIKSKNIQENQIYELGIRERIPLIRRGWTRKPSEIQELAGASDKVTPIRRSEPKTSIELHKYLDICKRKYLCNGIGSKSQSGVNTPDEIRDEWST